MPTPAESACKLAQQQPKPRLFQETDGCPLRFYIRPGTDKVELAPLILREGGRLCGVQEPGAILLARSGEVPASTHGNYVSTHYIRDCLAQKKRLPLEDYRLEAQLSPTATAAKGMGALQGRMPFTQAEDQAIVSYVRSKKQAGQAGSIAGTTFWKDMAEARVTSHPWQAMRDRYLKHLQGWVELQVPIKAPESKPSTSSAASQSKTVTDVSQPRDQGCTSGGSKIAGIFRMANKEFEDSEGDGEDLNSEEIPEHSELKTAEGSPKNPVVIPPDPKNPVVIPPDPKNPLVIPPDPKNPLVIPPDPQNPVVIPPDPQNPVVIPPDPQNPVVISPDPEASMVIPPDPETPMDIPPEIPMGFPPEIKEEVVEFMNCEESAASESLLPMEKQTSSPSVDAVARLAWLMMNLMKDFGVDLATVTQAFLKTSGDVTAAICCLKSGQRSDGCPLWTRQDDVDLLKGAEDLRSKLVAKYGAGNVEARIAFRKH